MSKLSGKLAAGVRKVKAEQEQTAPAGRAPTAKQADPRARTAEPAAGKRPPAAEMHPARVWPD